MAFPWPDADDAVDLPLDRLGMAMLSRLVADDRRAHGEFPLRTAIILTWVAAWDRAAGSTRSQGEAAQARPRLVDALAEAWEWLRANGFLAAAVHRNADAFIVTRRGHEILDYIDPLDMVRAQRRLGVELHRDLADRLRPLTSAGAFEQAAFDALRQVEVRVRQMAGEPLDKRGQLLRGVPLMRKAFGEGGGLADPSLDRGEQDGLRDLFSGAFGAVRNPLGHRNVQWEDATQAAEMVLLADLLMRQLDEIEIRLPFDTEEGESAEGT